MENTLKQTKDIIKGHINEMFNINSEISTERLLICSNCPLYTITTFGPMCNNKLWINPKTNDTSNNPKKGYIRGCGCRLNAKTKLKDNHCIINKW